MARPGRSEDTSVPIWLKLSAADSAKMDQVLARPEFEGWTRGEWCLEIIQTALRYYTRPRPAGEPSRKRAPKPPGKPVPPSRAADPRQTPSPRRAQQSRRAAEPEPPRPPEPEPRQAAEPEPRQAAEPEPRQAAEPE